MINVFCDIVGLGTAIADYGAADRNNKGDRPGFRRLMNLGEQVEEAGPGFLRTVQILFLF